jgi:hypothetical protein
MIEDDRRAGFNEDRTRAAWLARIVDRHGWPGVTLVGEDGANAAWLLAQHADHDVEFQAHCLDLLEAAVQRGDAPASQVAYLTDRVRVNRGEAQFYGTQFHGVGADHRPRPIENPDSLDERRAAMGLGPFAEYVERMVELNARGD